MRYSNMNRSYYQESGKIINSKPVPMVEDKFIKDEKGEMVPDMEFIRDQAKKLNAKTVRTKGGAVLYFNDNYVLIGADGGERLNTPEDAKKDRSKFSLQLGGQTINEDQAYDKLKTNYPELSDEDINEIILTLKQEANNEQDEAYMGQYYVNPNDQTIPKLLMQDSLDERETMQQGGRMMNREEETEDQDGGMALGQIRAMQERLARLQQMIRPNSDLEPWVASKLTLADDYLNTVNDYMTYNPEQTGEEDYEEYDEEIMNPQVSQEAMMIMQQDVPMEMMRYGGNLSRSMYQRGGKAYRKPIMYVPSPHHPRYFMYQDSLQQNRRYNNPPVPGKCYPYCPEPEVEVRVGEEPKPSRNSVSTLTSTPTFVRTTPSANVVKPVIKPPLVKVPEVPVKEMEDMMRRSDANEQMKQQQQLINKVLSSPLPEPMEKKNTEPDYTEYFRKGFTGEDAETLNKLKGMSFYRSGMNMDMTEQDKLKYYKQGMSGFQPDAIWISKGDDKVFPSMEERIKMNEDPTYFNQWMHEQRSRKFGPDYLKKYPGRFETGGGIPPRYKNMGFTKVGAKRQSTRPGKKWMVLAKKGDDYKVVHGGYKGMKDFTQHHSEKRKDNFWNRMGGKNSSKATDPFSPLYWHKRFGTWKEGGKLYNTNSLSNVDNVDYIENMKRGGMFNLAKARVLYRKGIHNFDQRNPYEHGGYMNDNLSFIEKNRMMRMNRKP